ncbi:MAG: hypothetical protein KDA25_05295 [Phycisphaerales bacterium]|nr:hypothetical protein [Phycisphaerales bacterium]
MSSSNDASVIFWVFLGVRLLLAFLILVFVGASIWCWNNGYENAVWGLGSAAVMLAGMIVLFTGMSRKYRGMMNRRRHD